MILYAVTSNSNGGRMILRAQISPDTGIFLLNRFRIAPVLKMTAGTPHQLALLVQTQSGKKATGLGVTSPSGFHSLVTKLRTKTINFTTASNIGASANAPSLARSSCLCCAGIDVFITPSNSSCHWWQLLGSTLKVFFPSHAKCSTFSRKGATNPEMNTTGHLYSGWMYIFRSVK